MSQEPSRLDRIELAIERIAMNTEGLIRRIDAFVEAQQATNERFERQFEQVGRRLDQLSQAVAQTTTNVDRLAEIVAKHEARLT